MKVFLLELKSCCKTQKLLALVLILIVFQLVMVQQALDEGRFQETAKVMSLRNADIGGAKLRHLDSAWDYGSLYTTEEHYQEARELYRHLSEVDDWRYQAYIAQDWVAYSKWEAHRHILIWRYDWSNILPFPEQHFGVAWRNVQDALELPEYNMHQSPLATGRIDGQAAVVTSSLYYLALMDTGLSPSSPYDTAPWAFLFNFMRIGLPTFLGIIVLLLTVNLLHRDRNSGVIKTQLSAPRSRLRYLLRKLVLGVGTSVVALVLALVPIGLTLGIRHGFNGLVHPVVIDKFGLANIVSPPSWATEQLYGPDAGLSQVFYSMEPERLLDMEFIPLWQFLLLAGAMLLLFVMFCTVLGLLISVVVKNEVFAHVVAGLVFVAGTAFGSVFPQLATSPWDFFARADVVPLLEGHHTATYVGGTLALGGGIVLLFLLSALIFRRQDITSS